MSRIVIVDNEPHICEALRDSLQADGYDVIAAHDGQTALALIALEIQRGPIAGVILDMEMPVVNGIEMLRRLRAQYPNLPILMISAHHDRNMADEVMRLGANAYLAKPFDRKQLVQLCSRLFRSGPPTDAKSGS
ncbi:MAG TPA: response regulator [Nitrospira sp.]|nr:response regulator [Nitrospira sp.]